MKISRKNPPQIPPGENLIDTHCHLDMLGYENLEEIITSAALAGVKRVITVGIDISSSKRAVQIADNFPGVFATMGIHPHNAAKVDTKTYTQLASLYENNISKVVGYGEIGLDYVKEYAPRDIQVQQFRNQLQIARDLNLPVIIHDRDAHDDTMHILKSNAPYLAGGVMHCFSGDSTMARKIIDLGFYISIPGIVTFNKSETLQQVVREIPLEHIILETDGPFLAPVPFRGKTNKPEYLVFTAGKIAELKDVPLAEVARRTTVNAEALFRLTQQETVH